MKTCIWFAKWLRYKGKANSKEWAKFTLYLFLYHPTSKIIQGLKVDKETMYVEEFQLKMVKFLGESLVLQNPMIAENCKSNGNKIKNMLKILAKLKDV